MRMHIYYCKNKVNLACKGILYTKVAAICNRDLQLIKSIKKLRKEKAFFYKFGNRKEIKSHFYMNDINYLFKTWKRDFFKCACLNVIKVAYYLFSVEIYNYIQSFKEI